MERDAIRVYKYQHKLKYRPFENSIRNLVRERKKQFKGIEIMDE